MVTPAPAPPPHRPIDEALGLLSAQTDPLYAVVDSARDPTILRLLHDSGEPFECLYTGETGHAMREVAPYLVELSPGGSLLSQLVRRGWGHSWCVFCTSQENIYRVRGHLRRFLRVQIEGGPVVFFRFYDPRVLRAYLPTCTVTERDDFFGPMTSVVCEDEDGRALLRFTPVRSEPDVRFQAPG